MANPEHALVEGIYREHAFDQAKEALVNVAYHFKTFAEKLDKRIQEMQEYEDGKKNLGAVQTTPEDCFVWAINEIDNFGRNINHDHLCRCAMKLAISTPTPPKE